MRRLAGLLVAGWLCFLPAITAFGFGYGFEGGAGGYNSAAVGGCSDANATAWVSAVVTAGGTVSAGQQTNVCNLIVALKGHGLFTKADRLWLLASENTQQAKIDIIGLNTTGTVTGTPTFTASQGYTGTGSSYINSSFIPSSSGVAYTLNSASLGVYVRNNRTASAGVSQLAGNDGSSLADLAINSFSGNTNLYLNEVINLAFASTTAQGFWVGSRTASNARALYRNGNTTPVASDTHASSALPTVFLSILGQNNNGSNVQGCTDQIAVIWIGGALNSTDIGNLSTDINGGYMSALGTNVY